MKHNISKNAVCPHYKHEDRQVIYCDGVVDGSVIHIAFANVMVAKDYKTRFCKDACGYGECDVFRMLEEKERARKS